MPNKFDKNILIYGAGSLGCFLASKLYTISNVDVIGRSKVKDIGEYIYINGENYRFPPVLSEINKSKHYDYIFLTSKYFDTKRNLEAIINSGVTYDEIVLVHDSYFDNSWFLHLIKDKPISTIVAYEGYDLEKDKLTYICSEGWFIDNDVLGKGIYNLFISAGIKATLTDDLLSKRIEKTLRNVSVNVFSVLYKKKISELVEDKKILRRMHLVFLEAYDVFSEFCKLKSKRTLWESFLEVAKDMQHYPTMYQDVKRNKCTQLSFHNGLVVELGRKMDLKTPHNVSVIQDFKKLYPKLY